MGKLILRVVVLVASYLSHNPCHAQVYDDDLRLISGLVLRYEVKNLSASEACKKLFSSVLGKGANIGIKLVPDDLWRDEKLMNNITLNLHDAPSSTVLTAIAELSAASWKIEGWPGAPVLTLTRNRNIDDTGLYYSTRSFAVSLEGAEHLGLTSNLSAREVSSMLGRHGVKFGNHAMAMWNSASHLLAIRNSPEEIEVVAGLVRLTNEGWQLIPP